MSDAPPLLTPDDWLGAFVPLGVARDRSWLPLGAGVLLVDAPVVWLLTARSVLTAAGDQRLAAFVSEQRGGLVLDLTTGRRGSPLDWLIDEEHDLAACLVPVDPAWGTKAFSEARCAPTEQLQPGTPVQALSCVYGVPGVSERTAPLLLTGVVARRDPARLVTTVPLPPHNAGAPLLLPLPVQLGGGVALLGLLTRGVAVPEVGAAPPLRLSLAVPISAALSLVRSEPGKAQRRLALTSSRPAAVEDACSP